MSEGEGKGLMADSAWLEGVASDLEGEALPAALIDWKEDLPEALREVCNRIATADGGVWLVGGSVREAMLGNPWKDLDLATSLNPDVMLQIFPRALPTGAQYGTVTVRLVDSDLQFEVTTLRSEGSYGDGRRPDEIAFGESLKEDLSRRDFTINAMALDLARNVLHDPYGGQEDLGNQCLTAVGDATERLGEDGLRLLRAYRFMDQGKKGVWQPDGDLAKALVSCGQMLKNVSEERVWSEFRKILSGGNAAAILERMRIDGMLSRILPGWDADISIQHLLDAPEADVFACRLVLLASDIPNERWRRLDHDLRALTLSNRDRNRVMNLHRLLNHLPSDLSEYRRYRASVGDLIDAHLAIENALNPQTTESVRQRLTNLAPLKAGSRPLIDGHVLATTTELPFGRRLGRLKEWLYRIQIEQDLANSDEVLALLDVLDWVSTDPELWPDTGWP
jgi:tRNA nucleotidyltransferase/poly(A) polymerase|tara:strand:- start:162 stop:1511 length:1350 start_codon:yes stop_codon:yes gene_type:complete